MLTTLWSISRLRHWRLHGSVIDDENRSVNGRVEADDGGNDDEDDDEDDVDEPAIELERRRTDVTVVGRLLPVGCNRAKTVPVVRLDTLCTADVCSV